MRTCALASALLLTVAGATGCASTHRVSPEQMQIARYQQQLAERDVQLATLAQRYIALEQWETWQRMQVAKAERAQQVLTAKLERLTAYNEEMDRYLVRAEGELARLRETKKNKAGTWSSASDAEAERMAEDQIAVLRRLREDNALHARTVAELVRTVQHLVDRGKLQLARDQDNVEVRPNRPLDIVDPWLYR